MQDDTPPGASGEAPSRTVLTLVATTASAGSGQRDVRLDDWMVAVAVRQDRDAFARLFDHFAPKLKGWLWKSGSSSEEAEEITQDAFVIVWRKAVQFDPARASVGSWLFTIARNLRIDRRRAIHDTWTTLDDAQVQDIADSGIGQEDAMDRHQHDELVRSALSRLTDDQRRLVQLSFYEDMSHSRIAAELKMPLGTVKTRLRAAATGLRKLLEDCRP